MKKITVFLLCGLLMLSFCIISSAESIEISRNAEYSLVTSASSAYPDDGKKLTDGIYGTHPEGYDGFYASGAYVGFNKDNVNESGKFAIILDLGKKYSNISSVTVGYLHEISAGISAPMSVSVALSDERNGSYAEIGVIDTIPEDIDAAETYAKALETANATGRFVLVTITPMGYTDKEGITSIAPWTFIDEIAVHISDAPDDGRKPTDDEKAPNDPDGSSTSLSPDVSDTSNSDNTPQTGDNLEIFAFVLLALASFAMMIALFTTKRHSEF